MLFLKILKFGFNYFRVILFGRDKLYGVLRFFFFLVLSFKESFCDIVLYMLCEF